MPVVESVQEERYFGCALSDVRLFICMLLFMHTLDHS
jgi:hypothetical protein